MGNERTRRFRVINRSDLAISIGSDGKATFTGNVAVHRQHDKPSKIIRAEKMVLDLSEIKHAAPNGGSELDTSKPTAVILP